MPPSDRCPRGPDGASSGRRGKGAQEAGGQRLGPSGHTSGHAHLTWACAEAATRFLRGHEPGPKSLARLAKKPATETARRLLAHPRARAVSVRLQRPTAFHREPCRGPSGAERVSPAPHAPRKGCVCTRRTSSRSGRRRGTRWAVSAPYPCAPPCAWPRALALREAAFDRRRLTCAAPPPSLRLTGELPRRSPALEEDGRRGRPQV
jgi:hypothetical protein